MTDRRENTCKYALYSRTLGHIFDESADGTRAQVKVGHRFAISLGENPTTGYTWHLVTDGAGVCTLIGDRFRVRGFLLGRSGVHQWLFLAAQLGTCSIMLEKRRSSKSSVAQRFHVEIMAVRE